MRICGNKVNLTLGFTTLGVNNLLTIEEKIIKGYLGRILSSYLELDKKDHLCKIISVSGIGEKFSNNSWSINSSIHLLKNKVIDIIARPQSLFLMDEPLLKSTKVVLSEGFYVGQFFTSSPKKEKNNVFSMFNLNLSFKLVYLIELLFIYAFLFLIFSKFSLKFMNKFKLMITSFTKLPSYLLRKSIFFSLIFILISVNFSFIKSMITNNINTLAVIVDTHNIIETKSDLLNTKFKICYIKDEVEYYIVKTEPKGNYLNRVFLHSALDSTKRVCIAGKNIESALEIYNNKRILFLTQLTLSAALSSLTTLMDDNHHLWINRIPFFEFNSVYYYSELPPLIYLKDKSKRGREIVKNYELIVNFYPQQELENGLYYSLHNKVYDHLHNIFIHRIPIYFKLSDYVNSFSSISSIEFDYFKSLFIAIIIIYTIILFLFLIQLNCIKKWIKLKRRQITVTFWIYF